MSSFIKLNPMLASLLLVKFCHGISSHTREAKGPFGQQTLVTHLGFAFLLSSDMDYWNMLFGDFWKHELKMAMTQMHKGCRGKEKPQNWKNHTRGVKNRLNYNNVCSFPLISRSPLCLFILWLGQIT